MEPLLIPMSAGRGRGCVEFPVENGPLDKQSGSSSFGGVAFFLGCITAGLSLARPGGVWYVVRSEKK